MTFKELRQASGMTQKEFAEYFHIPKRSIENWDEGSAKVSEYWLDLMEYKLRKENIIKENSKMKRYAVIDRIKDGDMFEEYFATEKEALAQAEHEWNHMTEYDKNRREMYDVMYGEYDEDEGFDFNSAETIKSFK